MDKYTYIPTYNPLLDSIIIRFMANQWIYAPKNRIFGFLLGSTLAGAATYYYILEEYRVSNELLTEDIYVSNHRSDSLDKLYERVAI